MKRTKNAILLVLLLTLLLPARMLRSRDAIAAPGVLRLHILANSDNTADQALKLQVRDALLPLFEAAENYEDARAFVLNHGAALQQTCQRIPSAAGAPYGAQLLLGVGDFPDRTYNGIRFPAGAYDALKIVLGAGAGHNWWCVLFPPLCIVTPDGEPLSQSVTFESSILSFFRRRFR